MVFPIHFSPVGNVRVIRNLNNFLNRGFPELRSTSLRKILTLRGSCKTSFSKLRVFDCLVGLDDADMFNLSERDKAGTGGSLTRSLKRKVPFVIPDFSEVFKSLFRAASWRRNSRPCCGCTLRFS